MRFAVAALILGVFYYLLAKVIAVTVSVIGQEIPKSLEEILLDLVLYRLELGLDNTKYSITIEVFYSILAGNLELRLA